MTECDHVWVRRRDGCACALCGVREFGESAANKAEDAAAARLAGLTPIQIEARLMALGAACVRQILGQTESGPLGERERG